MLGQLRDQIDGAFDFSITFAGNLKQFVVAGGKRVIGFTTGIS